MPSEDDIRQAVVDIEQHVDARINDLRAEMRERFTHIDATIAPLSHSQPRNGFREPGNLRLILLAAAGLVSIALIGMLIAASTTGVDVPLVP